MKYLLTIIMAAFISMPVLAKKDPEDDCMENPAV